MPSYSIHNTTIYTCCEIAVKHMNVVQKILRESNGFITVSPKHVLTHDNTMAVLQKYKTIVGKGQFSWIHCLETPVHLPSTPVFVMDHDIQNPNSVAKYKTIAAFANQQGIDYYPPGTGIGHQIMIEQGYAFPNTLVMASDSHANMYGGIGALGTPIVRTDAAAIWATGNFIQTQDKGQTWWQIPPVTRVYFNNKLPMGSTGKDVILALCGLLNKDQVLNHAIEFHGPGIQHLSIDDRLTIANMTTEWGRFLSIHKKGALAGLFPVDDVLIEWFRHRAEALGPHPRINHARIDKIKRLVPDEDAQYASTIELDLSTVYPFVAGPNDVKKATMVTELHAQHIPIQKAYLISCTNARLSDFKSAAQVLQDKKVKEGVEFYVAPASQEVQRKAEALGYWQTLLNAGAKVLPSGCGPCIGLGQGLLQKGEVGISSSNRNFKGRMGSPLAEAYLASPSVVAASALKGYITGPELGEFSQAPAISIIQHTPSTSNSTPMEPVEGFKDRFEGPVLFCDADNLNTDGIYPGKYTYMDGLSEQDMAKVTMENYDSTFASIVKPNSILVSGFNFGTGSSREQAATSLKAAGVQLILAASFSETFKRNAINNGLLVLECPSLVRHLRKVYTQKQLTRVLGKAQVHLSELKFTLDNQHFTLPTVGKIAQELVVEGGLEQWVKNRIHKV